MQIHIRLASPCFQIAYMYKEATVVLHSYRQVDNSSQRSGHLNHEAKPSGLNARLERTIQINHDKAIV